MIDTYVVGFDLTNSTKETWFEICQKLIFTHSNAFSRIGPLYGHSKCELLDFVS